jgi:hypothetical protein
MRVAPLLAVVLVVAGCGFGGTKTTTVTRTVTTQASGADQFGSPTLLTYFGEPVSTTPATLPKECAGAGCPSRKGYALVVKPEFFLTGATATALAAAGSSCGLACPPVPDDYEVIPAGTKNLTFALPAGTKGTVIPQGATKPITITAAQFAALVGGATTPQLFEPLNRGVWFTVGNGDTVRSFAQQYRP